ncbi:MAG: hypothetical protein AB3X44_09320 [Leptothrix sp. (in: b-proteobacteria)]
MLVDQLGQMRRVDTGSALNEVTMARQGTAQRQRQARPLQSRNIAPRHLGGCGQDLLRGLVEAQAVLGVAPQITRQFEPMLLEVKQRPIVGNAADDRRQQPAGQQANDDQPANPAVDGRGVRQLPFRSVHC